MHNARQCRKYAPIPIPTHPRSSRINIEHDRLRARYPSLVETMNKPWDVLSPSICKQGTPIHRQTTAMATTATYWTTTTGDDAKAAKVKEGHGRMYCRAVGEANQAGNAQDNGRVWVRSTSGPRQPTAKSAHFWASCTNGRQPNEPRIPRPCATWGPTVPLSSPTNPNSCISHSQCGITNLWSLSFLDHLRLSGAPFALVFTYFRHGMMIPVSFPPRYRSSRRWQPPSSIYTPLRWPFHLVQRGHGIVDSSAGNAMLEWRRHRTIQTYCMYLSY